MRNIYPYIVSLNPTQQRILCWCAAEQGADYFLTDAAGHLISFNSLAAITASPLFQGETNLHIDESATLNLMRFSRVVRGIKAGKPMCRKACEILLEGFNFLEDMAFTLKLAELQLLQTDQIKHILSKLFFGNHLAAVTPEQMSYHPIWTRGEARVLQRTFRQLWQAITPQLSKE